jgi:hypothetical protein
MEKVGSTTVLLLVVDMDHSQTNSLGSCVGGWRCAKRFTFIFYVSNFNYLAAIMMRIRFSKGLMFYIGLLYHPLLVLLILSSLVTQ